jgi:hypothetical protein
MGSSDRKNIAPTQNFGANSRRKSLLTFPHPARDRDRFRHGRAGLARKTAHTFPHPALEHVPGKLTDFSDQNMLQLFDLEHLLLARVAQPERNML